MPVNGGAWESFVMIVKVCFVLVFVILLFYLIIRVLAKRNQMIGSRQSIRSLGGVPLGQNKSIQIVEIGHCLYLVGVGENIQLLEKIDDPDEVAFLTELLTNKSSNMQFASISDWFQKARSKKNHEIEEDVTSSYQQVFYDRMQNSINRKKRFEDILQEKQTERLNDE
jgi:flagellar protein FliO/FliZ